MWSVNDHISESHLHPRPGPIEDLTPARTHRPSTELHEADRERLTWLATVGQVDAEQLALRFGGDPNWIRERMRHLQVADRFTPIPTPGNPEERCRLPVTDSTRRSLSAAPPPAGPADAIATWSLVTLRALAELEGQTVDLPGAGPPDLVRTSPDSRRTLVHLVVGPLTPGRIATLLEVGLDDEDRPRALVLVGDEKARERVLEDPMAPEWGSRWEVRVPPGPRVEEWQQL